MPLALRAARCHSVGPSSASSRAARAASQTYRFQKVPSDFEQQGGDGPIEAQVKWYNARKGFGFVLGPDGQDVFFHA